MIVKRELGVQKKDMEYLQRPEAYKDAFAIESESQHFGIVGNVCRNINVQTFSADFLTALAVPGALLNFFPSKG